MRAWRVHEYGPYRDVLRVDDDAPAPSAPPAGAVIDVAAASLNFPDLLAIAGQYQVKAPLPFTPGLEAAGTIATVGSQSKYKVGDRVIAFAPWGAFGEQLAVSDNAILPWPDGLDAAEAASFLVTYQTGWFALARRAQLRAGETLLVLGAAGGVGLAAIQLGKALGARVLAVAGGPDKLAACTQAGADAVIDHRASDFVAEVQRLTGNKGVDVVYDPVGGETTDRAIKALAWEGRLVVIGFASGTIPAVKLNRVLLKNIALVGLHWGAYFAFDPPQIAIAHAALADLVGKGAIRPHVSRRLAFDELPLGLAALESRASIGNLSLTVR